MQSFTIKQGTTPPAGDVAPPGKTVNQLFELQQQANRLELQLSDMSVKVSQLADRRARADDASRPALDKQWADAQHDMTATAIELSVVHKAIELSAVHKTISQLEGSLNQQQTFTLEPPQLPGSNPFLDGDQILQFAGGAAMLLLPIVLVLARNLWVRGSRTSEAVDIEASPRLQRIEQAIEAIAVEVERIGEAQRFSTKLLSERPAEPVMNRAAARREVGSITPH